MVLGYLENSKRNALRNQVMFLLSLHGLRAKEIADLQVYMVLDADGRVGNVISLHDDASKGNSGRQVPMSAKLILLLRLLLNERVVDLNGCVIQTERSEKFSPNAVAVYLKRLYDKFELVGCFSHSGRRTFITNCARNVSKVGGSLSVMHLAGHKHIGTT